MDPDLNPDPGVKKAPGPGPATLLLLKENRVPELYVRVS
jgi:hypothetical protein